MSYIVIVCSCHVLLSCAHFHVLLHAHVMCSYQSCAHTMCSYHMIISCACVPTVCSNYVSCDHIMLTFLVSPYKNNVHTLYNNTPLPIFESSRKGGLGRRWKGGRAHARSMDITVFQHAESEEETRKRHWYPGCQRSQLFTVLPGTSVVVECSSCCVGDAIYCCYCE